jgi:hypothetical protein
MLHFFDSVYYRVCKAYSSTRDSSPEFAAVCVVALMQAFNLLSFAILFEIVVKNKSLTKLEFVSPIIIFVVFNYIRYIYKENNNYTVIKERCMSESPDLRNRNGTIVLLYIIGSFSVFIGLDVYIGGKKW